MSERTVLKAEKDYSKEVDALLPEAQQLAKVCLLSPLEIMVVMIVC